MARDKADPVIRELYLHRIMRGMNITEVSERSNIDRSTISKAELGFQSPNLSIVRKWAQGLGFDLTLTPLEDES